MPLILLIFIILGTVVLSILAFGDNRDEVAMPSTCLSAALIVWLVIAGSHSTLVSEVVFTPVKVEGIPVIVDNNQVIDIGRKIGGSIPDGKKVTRKIYSAWSYGVWLHQESIKWEILDE